LKGYKERCFYQGEVKGVVPEEIREEPTRGSPKAPKRKPEGELKGWEYPGGDD